MKKIITLFALAFITANAFSQLTWTKLYTFSNSTKENHVAVSNDDTKILGYIGGTQANPLLLSTDNGSSWNPISTVQRQYAIIVDDVGGIYRIKGSSTNTRPDSVFYSTDNGNSWTLVSRLYHGPNYHVNGGGFLHRRDNKGYIYLGDGPDGSAFKYTADNGASWTSITPPHQPFSALVASDGAIYVSTYNKGVYVSTDGGASWDNSGYSGTSTAFHINEHLATGDIYMVVAGMAIRKTTDKGQNWTTAATRPNLATINNFFITSDNVFYMATREEIFESTDGSNYGSNLWDTDIIPFYDNIAISDNYIYVSTPNQTFKDFIIYNDSSIYRAPRPTTLSGINALNKISISIYPNPSSGVFALETAEAVQVNIYNIIGEKVWSKKVFSHETIDLSEQPRGTYVVTFTSGEAIQSKKIIIE